MLSTAAAIVASLLRVIMQQVRRGQVTGTGDRRQETTG
jgi:hypothetical protein